MSVYRRKEQTELFTKRVIRLESRVMTRRVLLYPGEDGFVVAEVPSLPGCISQGKTREEALENVREAISLHEEVLRERGEPLPEDRVELVEVAA
jgi:predicted RNase H-like HicB family nuclease